MLPGAPVDNVSAIALEEFKQILRPYKGWLIALGILSLFNFLLLGIFCIGLFALYGYILNQVKSLFWKEFAESRGWSYEENRSIVGEKALLFREGDTQMARHTIRGTYNDQPLSLFEYTYTEGSGKHKRTYRYTIFEIKFAGVFPHLYLNNITNGDYVSFFSKIGLPKLSLPAEFEKKFALYAPKEYEIEALAIFSPNTLNFLLDTKWRHDFELVESELIISRMQHIGNRNELESELAAVQKLIDHLAPKLNRASFSPIGNYPATL